MNEAVKVALDRFLLLADARSELEFAQYIVKTMQALLSPDQEARLVEAMAAVRVTGNDVTRHHKRHGVIERIDAWCGCP